MRFLLTSFLWAGVLSLVPTLQAQDEPPKLSLFPQGYLAHEALSQRLKAFETDHPKLVRVRSLTKTAQGRDVWIVRLTRADDQDRVSRRPSVMVVADLEGDHLVGSQVALGLIEKLVKEVADKSDGDTAKWFDAHALYFIPRFNPDGAERVFGKPALAFRTNVHKLDRDRDGRTDEDGPDDLDGDGLLLRMRVRDDKSNLIADPKDSRLSKLADRTKGERPVFSEYPEGSDNDDDGQLNEDPASGVNLHRQWPYRWPEFEPESGPYPGSEPEVFALLRFAYEHPQIAVVWTLGLADNLRNVPNDKSGIDRADLPFFVELARRSKEAVTKIKGGSGDAAKPLTFDSVLLPDATPEGSLPEWAYQQFGALSLASRPWALPDLPEPKKDKDQEKEKDAAKEKEQAKPPEGEARWLAWNDRAMDGRAFVPFKPFEHPVLGRVEIGGWKPGVRLNPPIEQVAGLVDAHLAILKTVLPILPELHWTKAKVEPKGGGLYAVSATLDNTGLLPTALAQGVTTRKAPPVVVRIKLPTGAKLLGGQPIRKVDTLGGSGGTQAFRWLIRTTEADRGQVTIEAEAARAGSVTATLELPEN